MKMCKKCVQLDTRPSIVFDIFGVCPACNFAEKFGVIDWKARDRELKTIINQTLFKKNSKYDCALGVSGGKDSIRLATYAKEVLGLNVLLINCSSSPEMVTELGVENISTLVEMGFDMITIAPAPQTWKKLIKKSFYKYGNIHKTAEMALYASTPRVALSYGIPLVFIGENPAITLGELGTGSTGGDAGFMRNSNTIASGPDEFMDDEITPEKLIWYRYPSIAETSRADLRILYLGYYIKDFGKIKNAEFSMSRGMQVRADLPENMGDLTGYEQLDDHFALINQMMKFLKLGFGKVADQVCEEIRLGSMTRDEGIELVRLYDGKCHEKYIRGFCDFIEISYEEFWRVADSFRNKNLWELKNGEWVFKINPYI